MDLGKVVMTRKVADLTAEDVEFANNIIEAMRRYVNKDWGECSEDDKALNDEALKNGDSILASYSTNKGKVWIITECDRSSTTILFPEEY